MVNSTHLSWTFINLADFLPIWSTYNAFLTTERSCEAKLSYRYRGATDFWSLSGEYWTSLRHSLWYWSVLSRSHHQFSLFSCILNVYWFAARTFSGLYLQSFGRGVDMGKDGFHNRNRRVHLYHWVWKVSAWWRLLVCSSALFLMSDFFGGLGHLFLKYPFSPQF